MKSTRDNENILKKKFGEHDPDEREELIEKISKEFSIKLFDSFFSLDSLKNYIELKNEINVSLNRAEKHLKRKISEVKLK